MNDHVELPPQVDQAVQTSRSFVDREVTRRTSDLSKSVSKTADDLRQIGEELRKSQTVGSAAGLADRGAEAVSKVANYLDGATGASILSDIEEAARKNPLAAAGSAVLIGMLGSRFLRSTSLRRTYGDRYGTSAN